MYEKYTGGHITFDSKYVRRRYEILQHHITLFIHDIQYSNFKPIQEAVFVPYSNVFHIRFYTAITINVNPPNRNALKDFEFSVCSFYFLKLNKTDCLYRNWSCRQYSFCLYINGYKNRDRDIELHSYLTPKYGRHFIVWHINISVMQNQNNIYYIYLRI